MTAVHATVDRQRDEVTIKGVYINRFKKPENIKIERSQEPPQGVAVAQETILKGDIGDVQGIMFGLAEMAWGMGWRPRALVPTLAAAVQQYKIPPVTG